jgi:hypothetical protein
MVVSNREEKVESTCRVCGSSASIGHVRGNTIAAGVVGRLAEKDCEMDVITRFYVACCQQADVLNRELRNGPDAIRAVLRETSSPSIGELFRDAYAVAKPEAGRALTRLRRRADKVRNQAAEIANFDNPATTYPLSWSTALGEFNESRSEAWGFCPPESDGAPLTDLIWYQDIAAIAGVVKKAVQNRASEWKKQCAGIADPCSYDLIKPFLIKQWPVFPADYAAMRQILALKRHDSP